MSAVLSVISLTVVHSSPVVAAPCSVGLAVVSGSKSNGILVSATEIIGNITHLFPATTVRIPRSPCFLLIVKSTTHTAGIDTHG